MGRWAKRMAGGVVLAGLTTLAGAFLWFELFGYALGPNDARIVYDDLDRFAAAAAELPSVADSVGLLQGSYIDAGSRGLGKYGRMYGVTGETLARAMHRLPHLYRSPENLAGRVRETEPAVRRALAEYERIYPRAMYPPVYYLVGNARAGGANSSAGVLIAAELYGGRAGETDTSLTRDSHMTSDLPCLVTHELTHFNHFVASPIVYVRRWDNLARAIKEGAADFMAELSAGCHINDEAHAWGLPHEATLWEEFRHVLASDDTGDWFFVRPESGDRPQDLGYFLGYRIVRTFYERAQHKPAAIRRIMNISDYHRFLAESGYGGNDGE